MNLIVHTFSKLLRTRQLLTEAEFMRAANLTDESLKSAVASNRLFFVEVRGVRAYPAFFLSDLYRREDLEVITETLDDLSGGAKWLFFTRPKCSLSVASASTPRRRTPLEALKDGECELVRRSARSYVER